MTNDILRGVMNENEELKAENYNLTLYLTVVIEAYTCALEEMFGENLGSRKARDILSEGLNEFFDGMPGYAPQRYDQPTKEE